MSDRSQWQILGEMAGVLPDYINFDGSQRVVTPDETYRAILKSLGYENFDPESLQIAIQSKEAPAQSLKDDASNGAATRCVSCREKSSKRQLRGIWTNLYSLRSLANWGIGDFGDLKRLIQWAGSNELDFVAINPLHALRNQGFDISPYRPVSRLFRNEIYLDIESIPEFAHCQAARKFLAQPSAQAQKAKLQNSPLVHYESVHSLKRSVLLLLHQEFLRTTRVQASERRNAFDEYLQREGTALRDFATFEAIDEAMMGSTQSWRFWPNGLHYSRSQAVEDYRRSHPDEISFHCWVQFELDRQLSMLEQRCKECGLAVGLFGDLAIGTSPDGSDPWAFPDLFLENMSIGAPPDDLGPHGQYWGLPPINPHALRRNQFEFWTRLLRSNLAHMGALRIDHVMGLLRQFWIPEGFDGTQGAYMQFPAHELFSILSRESRRAGTIIVGEDLGTVPDGFRDLLYRFGVLSTRVVRFEREWGGRFKAADAYPGSALVVVGTHDMVPLAGYPQGSDLRLRAQLGQFTESTLKEALQQRSSDWDALKSRLKEEGFEVDNQSETASVCRAMNRFLGKMSASMVAVSLDDLAGECEPVNVPGVGLDRHRSWSRKMAMTMESIVSSEAIRDALRFGNPS